jgi:hypothetical protein
MNARTTVLFAGALAFGMLAQLQSSAQSPLAPGMPIPEDEAEATRSSMRDIRETITRFPSNLLWQPAQGFGACRLIVNESVFTNSEPLSAGSRFSGVFRTIWKRDAAQYLVCLLHPGIQSAEITYGIFVFDGGLKPVGMGEVTTRADYIPYGIVEFRQTKLNPRDIVDDAWHLGIVVTHPTNRVDLSRDISLVSPGDEDFRPWLYTNRLLVERLRASKSPIEVRFGHQPAREYEFRTAEPNLVVDRNGIVNVRGRQSTEKAVYRTSDPSVAPAPQVQR